MMNDQIQEFLTRVVKNENINRESVKLNQKAENRELFEKDCKKFINNVILPEAKKLGYQFTEADFIYFLQSQDAVKLTTLLLEDMEDVSGGVVGIAAAGVGILSAIALACGVTFANWTNKIPLPSEKATIVQEAQKVLKYKNKSIHDLIENLLTRLDEVNWVCEKLEQDQRDILYYVARGINVVQQVNKNGDVRIYPYIPINWFKSYGSSSSYGAEGRNLAAILACAKEKDLGKLANELDELGFNDRATKLRKYLIEILNQQNEKAVKNEKTLTQILNDFLQAITGQSTDPKLKEIAASTIKNINQITNVPQSQQSQIGRSQAQQPQPGAKK